jgi:ATP-dependent protease Clp ATPase subunit
MALELGNGARGLRNLLETVLADIMFDAPNNTGKSDVVEFRITEDMVREKIETRYKNVLALKRAM